MLPSKQCKISLKMTLSNEGHKRTFKNASSVVTKLVTDSSATYCCWVPGVQYLKGQFAFAIICTFHSYNSLRFGVKG